jgi:alcohol dehydrogenase
MRTMQAAVLEATARPVPYADSRPLSICEVELAPPERGEVLVKIKAAGLCHSDLSAIDGSRARPTPMILGHEASGVVDAVGAGVTDLSAGDHVVTVFVPSCGLCPPCAEGRPALCEPGAASNVRGALIGGGTRLRRGETPVFHHIGVSCFAEYAVVARASLVKIPRDVPMTHAALFGCAVLTGMGAVVNASTLVAGGSIAVIGLGGVGLAAVLGASVSGARRIIALDILPAKRDLAMALGATDSVDPRMLDAVSHVRDLSGGGVDTVIETAGATQALELGFDLCRRGGTIVSVGLPHPQHTAAIPHARLTAEERIIRGSYVGSCVPSRDIPRFVELYSRGRLPVEKLLSHEIKLQDINSGFDRLRDGTAIRQVVVFD